ncbi:probable protein phosphatase CG10417 [Stomoxys calcitrans]|uniref:probable protein phosphatase CG10417 n=1 Tax=Stomoxys calcitrans TaxID=35570 RepID=UPI0027E3332A|nr:probable protein phosphatase CG10417 [Stomoxys calcitrans]
MGAYLSQPKTDKLSTDEFNNFLIVGASSMQGWRNSQEDAHNAILDFDEATAFFAVYDGHGGAEVSTYCADKLPNFLKALEAYKSGNIEQALKDAFLGFDKTLLDPAVIENLKVLAGEKNFVDGEDSDVMEDDDENLAELHEEGSLPLDEVMEKYKGHPSMPSLKKLKESGNGGSKPQSPYLRGRRAAAVIADAANRAELDPDSKPEGSSTSKAALAVLQDDGPSSSKSSSSLSANKVEAEEDSTVSSSSSSASKTNNTSNSANNAAEAEPSSSKTSNGKATESPDSSVVKENEQNGSVSSSETKTDLKTNEVSGSEPTSSDKEEQKQNGNVASSTKSPAKIDAANVSAISSTSKDQKDKKEINFVADDSNDEDEFDDEEEDLGEDDSTEEDEDADYDDDDEVEDEDEDGEEDEEDEESYLANEQFCANMIEEPGKDSGCTAVVGLLQGRDLYVANAGDSRCVVCRNGKAIEMSLDHKPEDDEESARIVKAGGRVTLDGRVNGGLNLSRALGDHAYKMTADLPAEEQMISALPDIKKLVISPEDEFMVLACDGIWNFMTSDEVVEFVRLRLKDENKKMSEICEELFDACLAPNTLGDGTGCDNMTAVIVRFKPSIQELPTKIDPNTTEDVLLLAKQSEVDTSSSPQKAQKRSASPTSDESNEAENQTKRLKTDNNKREGESSTTNNTSSSIATTTTSTTSKTASGDSGCTTSSTGEVDDGDAKMKEDDSSSAVESST